MNIMQRLDIYFKDHDYDRKRASGKVIYTKEGTNTLTFSVFYSTDYTIEVSVRSKNKIKYRDSNIVDSSTFERTALEMRDALTKYDTKTIDDFYALLQIGSNVDEQKRYKILQLRVAKLGEGRTCSRCGGSGHYSFNLIHGTRCFKCDGVGTELMPKSSFNNSLYNRLYERVLKGELENYLLLQQQVGSVKKIQKYGTLFLNAWTNCGIAKQYSWQKASQGIQPDKDLSDYINKPIHDHYAKLEKCVRSCRVFNSSTIKQVSQIDLIFKHR